MSLQGRNDLFHCALRLVSDLRFVIWDLFVICVLGFGIWDLKNSFRKQEKLFINPNWCSRKHDERPRCKPRCIDGNIRNRPKERGIEHLSTSGGLSEDYSGKLKTCISIINSGIWRTMANIVEFE